MNSNDLTMKGVKFMKRKLISAVLVAGMVMSGCSANVTPEATTALEQIPKDIVAAGCTY